ncbi:hypothetical protein RhiirA5_417941 [Rhizophagus irregularis]|uniref:RRM domain-containing protein n=1 Tax=Rhizophagus irregularis TaxID=588596 RepID=A0A2N0PLJ0_9GLOM|nr:hypothetical protein RhiirA5_417941 [Rhizophagus irregularis]
MTTPSAPSVINPDISSLPHPDTSSPSGDWLLSPNNTAGAPNKRSRTVSDDAMNVDITSPVTPASNLISSVPSGLPINKVQVITSPNNTTTPVETALVQSTSSYYHAAAYLCDMPDAFKSKFTTNRAICDKVDRAFSKLSSYNSRARCEGSGDKKRILVSFFAQADLTSSTSATYSKAQRDARRQYVAVLAGIPKNIKKADLTDIANQVSTKAINIPLSYTFYKLKPYVYINFFSQETLDSALKLTVSFKNQGLTWHLPDQLDKLYSRFKTGPQRGRNLNQFFRHSSSRSRSCSRPSCSARNTGNRSNNSRQSGQGHLSNTPFSTGPSSSRTQQLQPIGRPLVTPPIQTYPSITPEEIAALR